MPINDPRRGRSYRIKSTDNATTLPGRTFFPKGTYISQPNVLQRLVGYSQPLQATTQYPAMNAVGGAMSAVGNSLALAGKRAVGLEPFTPYGMSTGTQASGLSGNLGAPSAMYPTSLDMRGRGYYSPDPYYDMRKRGYGQPTVPNAAYSPGFNPTVANLQVLNRSGRGFDLAGGSPYSQPDPRWRTYTPPLSTTTAPPGMVETAIGTGSEEFMNTRFMQKNIENNTPFERQLRWDPDRKKYVQIGKLINEGRLNVKTGRLSRKKRRGGDEEPAPILAPAPVTQPVQQQVNLPSIANSFVSFRA